MPADQGRQIRDLLALVTELTGRVVVSESVGELVDFAFRTLFRSVPFDVGVTVMIEQHLDLYVTSRGGAHPAVDDALIARIRETLTAQIPVSFASTDVIIKSESSILPPLASEAAPVHETHALLCVERRTSGLLLIYRSDPPFTEADQQIMEIFASQLAMLLGSMQARNRLSALAETDDLTGIWNKRAFRRQLPAEVERARVYNVPLSLLIFDVDEFKQINDTFGHTVGDVVLSELCGAVRETLRPPDVFARFGGDEFSVILPHTDLAGARAVAERILQRVATLTIPTDEEGAIRCSISVGVAEFDPYNDTSSTDFVRRADERMYASKRQGKNRYTA